MAQISLNEEQNPVIQNESIEIEESNIDQPIETSVVFEEKALPTEETTKGLVAEKLKNISCDKVARHGEKPELKQFENIEEELAYIKNLIEQNDEYNTIAIITNKIFFLQAKNKNFLKRACQKDPKLL